MAAALALGGCVSVDDFGSRGLTYNEQIASAQNRMLFLNVVRAAYKHPMAFTSIGSVAGTATVSGQLGLTLPFARNPNLTAFQAGPQIGASGGPTFTVNNLDTQEFTKGVLAPVGIQTIDLFGQEGLPWQELYDLFIAQVAITDLDGHTLARLDNSPGDVGQERQFQALLAVFHDARLQTEEVDSLRRIGPVVDEKNLQTLEPMIDADKAGLRIEPVGPGRYQLEKTIIDYRFCVADRRVDSLHIWAAGKDYTVEITPGMHCGATDKERATDSQSKSPPGANARLLGVAKENSPQLNVTLRSAEGVTYYLGEVLREELCLESLTSAGSCQPLAPIMVQRDGEDGGRDPLMVAVRGAPNSRDLLSVPYMGETFSLRGGLGDRSAQVITILGQLVNLNKSAKDTPVPNIVTLVGH